MTSTALPSAVIWMSSGSFVPLTVTESAAPSPAPPPIAASRSSATDLRSVPLVSFRTALSAPPSAWTSMSSMSFRSIVMLATSRKNLTRSPLAETSKLSATPAPLKSSVSAPSSAPSWPSTTSLPSPGSQRNVSLPAPRRPVSSPRLPSIASSPSPPSSVSAPSPPLIVSFPAPPSIPSLIRAASPTAPEIVSLPSSPLTFRRSFAASELLDLHGRGQPGHVDRTRVGRDRDRVVAGRAVDRGRVDAPSPVRRRSRLEVELDVLDVGRGQVVHDRVVDPAERAKIDPLGVVDVHGDVRDVAEELQAVAVRGEVEALRDTGAVEDHRVGAGLPFHLVAPVAGIPGERVVAGPEETGVVSAVAVDRVVLAAAAQRVVAVAAVDRVVARSAVQRQLGQRGEPDCAVERVVAGQGLDGQRLSVDDVDRQAARPARDGDVRCDRRRSDTDRVVSGRALDDDAVSTRAGIEVQLVVRGLGASDVQHRADAPDVDRAADPELVCGRRALHVDGVRRVVVPKVGIQLAEPCACEVVDDYVVRAASGAKVEPLDPCAERVAVSCCSGVASRRGRTRTSPRRSSRSRRRHRCPRRRRASSPPCSRRRRSSRRRTTCRCRTPAWTTIRLKRERLNVNSAEPLPPTSTWSRDVLPGFNRSVILSLRAVPRTFSWPRWTNALTFGLASWPPSSAAWDSPRRTASSRARVRRGRRGAPIDQGDHSPSTIAVSPLVREKRRYGLHCLLLDRCAGSAARVSVRWSGERAG